MKISKNIVLILLLFFPEMLFAQYLSNPSLEGPPGIAISPPDWLPFSMGSTPDTEPLACDDFTASHGETYLTLVARGSSGLKPNSQENSQTSLVLPLVVGGCYSLSLDLASRDDLGHYTWGTGFNYYSAPVKLRIYGSNNVSDKGELLAETSPVTNVNWETVNFQIKAAYEINFLLLEVVLEEPGAENGNILIDHLILSEDPVESTVVLNETFIPADLPLTIEASESPSYSWSPSTGLSCYDCQQAQVNSANSRTYTCAIISSSTGCPAEELFILTFEEEPEEPVEPIEPGEFKIPNVFTPNGDGINDLFVIQGLSPYSSLLIYDRSGKELLSVDAYDNSWDGSDMEGNPLPEDTYWYVLITPGLDGTYKGQIYLKLK